MAAASVYGASPPLSLSLGLGPPSHPTPSHPTPSHPAPVPPAPVHPAPLHPATMSMPDDIVAAARDVEAAARRAP